MPHRQLNYESILAHPMELKNMHVVRHYKSNIFNVLYLWQGCPRESPRWYTFPSAATNRRTSLEPKQPGMLSAGRSELDSLRLSLWFPKILIVQLAKKESEEMYRVDIWSRCVWTRQRTCEIFTCTAKSYSNKVKWKMLIRPQQVLTVGKVSKCCSAS